MKDKVDVQTRPKVYVCECVYVGQGESECVFEWEKKTQADKLVNVHLFLLVTACCTHLSANPAKSVYLEIWPKPVGPPVGGGGEESEKCENWSGRHGDDLHDPGKGCCYCLSPLSLRTLTSAVLWRQDGAKAVNLHPAPLRNFPSRVFDSNNNLIRQRQRGPPQTCDGELRLPALTFWFLVWLTTTNKARIWKL